MYKKRGGGGDGGVNGFLNNVKKLDNWNPGASLRFVLLAMFLKNAPNI